MRTKKEARGAAEKKHQELQDEGWAVFRLNTYSKVFAFAYMKDDGEGLRNETFEFAPQKPAYPLGTMGYVWQDGAGERYLKELLRVEDGRYVTVRSHPGGCPGYWDNFSPLVIYGELEQHKTALGDMAKHFCAYLCSTRDYAGGDKCTGCPLEKCVNNPRVELVQHFLKVAKPK